MREVGGVPWDSMTGCQTPAQESQRGRVGSRSRGGGGGELTAFAGKQGSWLQVGAVPRLSLCHMREAALDPAQEGLLQGPGGLSTKRLEGSWDWGEPS